MAAAIVRRTGSGLHSASGESRILALSALSSIDLVRCFEDKIQGANRITATPAVLIPLKVNTGPRTISDRLFSPHV